MKTVERFCVCLLTLLCLCYAESACGQEPDFGPIQEVSLEDYVRSYFRLNNRLGLAKVGVDRAEVDVMRSNLRRTIDLSVLPTARGHAIEQGEWRGVGSGNLDAGLQGRPSNGHRWSVSGNLYAPTRSDTYLGGTRYGVRGGHEIPLNRNAGGELYKLEVASAQAVQEQALADLYIERLESCRDGIARYTSLYAAQGALRAYDDLLKEKRRIYGQTSRDYRRKMLTRLDYLAARSDLAEAEALRPNFEAGVDQAQAGFVAYFEAEEELLLTRPPPLQPPSEAHLDKHPRLAALEAERAFLKQELLLVDERNSAELDLAF